MKLNLSRFKRVKGLLVVLVMGIFLCIWQLGSTGLIDETPPLFASAGRAMAQTGDWLTPRVNGLPRYDKPPLVYWLMAMFYSAPGQDTWDPLGTWAGRLPSAITSVLMMLCLADTVMKWPHKHDPFPRRTGIITALAFALSPLVMLWSRIAVSDALLCGTLGLSLIFQWRQYVGPSKKNWWTAWSFLGLAVLAKGPVAIILILPILSLFGYLQKDFGILVKRIKPFAGLSLSALISLPWYLAELLVEGQDFWDSFFGYHNFQRFTSVVNSHMEPWWFFVVILIIASLPFTPLLLLSFFHAFSPQRVPLVSEKSSKDPEGSLQLFAACWLLIVFLLFTCSATKLPSYWLPATPAAALLIGTSYSLSEKYQKAYQIAWIGSLIIVVMLALLFWFSSSWIPYIKDPEMPSLSKVLISSRIGEKGAISLTISALVGLYFLPHPRPGKLLFVQVPLIIFHFLSFLPMWIIADDLRQLPLRDAADLIRESRKTNEAVAMVGAVKPSLHFYSNQIILFEGRSSRALVNLEDRLSFEKRLGWQGREINPKKGLQTFLLVIDKKTSQRSHWRDLNPEFLGESGIYLIWRVNRLNLQNRAINIISSGINANWREFKPERF